MSFFKKTPENPVEQTSDKEGNQEYQVKVAKIQQLQGKEVSITHHNGTVVDKDKVIKVFEAPPGSGRFGVETEKNHFADISLIDSIEG
jgi:hypothetical protein